MGLGRAVRNVAIAGGVLVGGAWLLDWVESQAATEIVSDAGGAAARKAAEKVKPPTGGGGGGSGGSAGRTKDKDKDEKRQPTATTTKPIGNSRVVPMPVVVIPG